MINGEVFVLNSSGLNVGSPIPDYAYKSPAVRSFIQLGTWFTSHNLYTDIPLADILTLTGDWGNASRVTLTNVYTKKTDNLSTGASSDLYYQGAYQAQVTFDTIVTAAGYVGYTVNGAASVNVTTVLGQAQATSMNGSGWATIYATRATATADGTAYLRIRAHTTANTITSTVETTNESYTGVFLETFLC